MVSPPRWLRFNSTFQGSEISNVTFISGEFFNKASHHELETFRGEIFLGTQAHMSRPFCVTSGIEVKREATVLAWLDFS